MTMCSCAGRRPSGIDLREAQAEKTTQTLGPGDFFEVEFIADNPGNWIFHCHVPHHTTNAMMSGYNGAPVGMTRIFHYAGYDPVPPEYFAYPDAGLPLTGGIPE